MNKVATSGLTHIVGAGLAGLAAAVALATAGRHVRVYEASNHAGGRCRSYFDAELGCRVDNGNHLLLAGNRNAIAYLDRVGARATVEGPETAEFPFVDTRSSQRWVLRPNRGRFPWWIFRQGRRVPQSRAADYLEALRLRRANAAATVGEVLDPSRALFERLWQPLAVAALNTGVRDASARLFWRILAETLGRGGTACRPLVPREGLSETFVDPALATLRKHGAAVHCSARLRALDTLGDHVSVLRFENEVVELAPEDWVILAIPASIAARLLPGIEVPEVYSPIVNAHFRCPLSSVAPLFIGVIGGTAEWIFRKREVLSVTVSAAERIVDRSSEELAKVLWRDAATAYDLPRTQVPPHRIVKERRATFLASPQQLLRRPVAATSWRNLLLAGDYTDTGLPATIEGAIASGFTAAKHSRISENRRTHQLKTQKARRLPAAINLRDRRREQPNFP